MHSIYQQLCVDHKHIQRLLRCMRGLAEPLEDEGIDAERLELMLDIIDYIKNYPEHWHHPIEDQVFSLLLLKHIPESDLLREIICDHGRLEKQTIELEQIFRSVAQGCVVPSGQLQQQSQAYIAAQADHIEKENKWAYPLMERYLEDDDWDWIGQKIPQLDDPLFGERHKGDYHNLYENIIEGEKDLLQ
ncbi:MAG: hemerythrin domain-containing protein [Cellvibrionaceae bacterium]|nr:hemerythrin domain-containing protein [Cellvibrionaceae bacterium]MCV6627005.1 hemerythrin domain-containing protein [Cellvibrionaceae bacterium]